MTREIGNVRPLFIVKKVFLVDRPLRGKPSLYAPYRSLSVDEVRRAAGPRTKVTEFIWIGNGKDNTAMSRFEFTRKYLTNVITWLRCREDCDYVKFRTVYRGEFNKPHCTPQCEGAWLAEEQAGKLSVDGCECVCGGLRHGRVKPWWKQYEAVTSPRSDGLIEEKTILWPLSTSVVNPRRISRTG